MPLSGRRGACRDSGGILHGATRAAAGFRWIIATKRGSSPPSTSDTRCANVVEVVACHIYPAQPIILRTSALYGRQPCRAKGGNNFVELMLRLGRERGEVRVVASEFVPSRAQRRTALKRGMGEHLRLGKTGSGSRQNQRVVVIIVGHA